MHNRYVHHGHMYQGQEHMHLTCIQTSGSRIIHTCMLQGQGPGSQICASYAHASESRIEDHKYVHHTHMHPTPRIALFVRLLVRDKISAASQIHAPYIHACFRIKVLYHRYVHHTHVHQSQGWRIVDMCITHTCIRVKDREHRYMHHTCMYQDQGSWINASCIYVHHRHMYQDQGSYRYVSWIYASHASGTHASRIYA